MLLGVLQAFIGWYMVKSGLILVPHVSHYRLTLHLIAALALLSLLFYEYYQPSIQNKNNKHISFAMIALIILTFLQSIFGGFIAGLKAGLVYNTFPLMEGKIIPDNLFFLEPIILNFFENDKLIQFSHRMIAYSLFIFSGLITVYTRIINSPLSRLSLILFLTISTQICLGIVTLLTNVDIVFAMLHQIGIAAILCIEISMLKISITKSIN